MPKSLRLSSAALLIGLLAVALVPDPVAAQDCCCFACTAPGVTGFVQQCAEPIPPTTPDDECQLACAPCFGYYYLAEYDCVPGQYYTGRGGTCAVPLPVELVGFSASSRGPTVTLLWATASETINAGFDVEQEIGSDVFEAIGYVEGHGTTAEPQEYTYTVTDLDPGRYVFRLKQTDFDGTFEYSETVEATVTVPDRYVLEAAYPNPFNPSTTIRFAVATEEPVTLTLVDSNGRTVRTLFSGTPAANDVQSVRIDAEGLSSGSYIVRLTGEGFVASETVVLLR